MIDIDIGCVLNYFAAEQTEPASSYNAKTLSVSKPNLCSRGGDQCFGAAILTVSVCIIPAMAKGCSRVIIAPPMKDSLC